MLYLREHNKLRRRSKLDPQHFRFSRSHSLSFESSLFTAPAMRTTTTPPLRGGKKKKSGKKVALVGVRLNPFFGIPAAHTHTHATSTLASRFSSPNASFPLFLLLSFSLQWKLCFRAIGESLLQAVYYVRNGSHACRLCLSCPMLYKSTFLPSRICLPALFIRYF